MKRLIILCCAALLLPVTASAQLRDCSQPDRDCDHEGGFRNGVSYTEKVENGFIVRTRGNVTTRQREKGPREVEAVRQNWVEECAPPGAEFARLLNDLNAKGYFISYRQLSTVGDQRCVTLSDESLNYPDEDLEEP